MKCTVIMKFLRLTAFWTGKIKSTVHNPFLAALGAITSYHLIMFEYILILLLLATLLLTIVEVSKLKKENKSIKIEIEDLKKH